MGPVGNKSASVEGVPLTISRVRLATKRGIDGVWRSLEESLEIIPAKNVRRHIGKFVVVGSSQMKFSEEPTRVVLRSQNSRRCHLKWRHF